tara:strand:+ start:4849 stop:5487 length:639 start_codon:yes stop_codon:yes gene_type:complete
MMVNIQIRGELYFLSLYRISTKQLEDISYNNYNISMQLYNNHTGIEEIKYDHIYNISMPVLSQDTQIQVTSFDNSNYYDEGHTFLRETLEIINIRDSEFSLNIDNDSSDFILVTINHGYGTAFETEIMDLDYSNFQIQNFTSLASIIPWNDKKIIHNIKLNHLPLNDLNRKKYGIMKTESRVIKTKYLSELLLNNFLKNFEDVHSDSFMISD